MTAAARPTSRRSRDAQTEAALSDVTVAVELALLRKSMDDLTAKVDGLVVQGKSHDDQLKRYKWLGQLAVPVLMGLGALISKYLGAILSLFQPLVKS
jgi:hypothetical protein